MDLRWLGNPWFVGIVTAIPSGLLVNWLTKVVLGRRDNREYLQKLNSANRDIVYAIRPGISEGEIPSAEVLTSLINATARRYGVEPTDLYTAPQIAEELVKEVMDSSFISSSQKAEFCAKLTQLASQSKIEKPAEPAKSVPTKTAAEYRERLTSMLSMMLGFVTAVMMAALPLFEMLKTKERAGGLRALTQDKHVEILLPMLAVLGTMAISLLAMMLYRDVNRRRRRVVEEMRRIESELYKSSSRILHLNSLLRSRRPPEE